MNWSDIDRGIKGLSYDYSDRLHQWDATQFENSAKAANETKAPRFSANWFSTFMTFYKGKTIVVHHVMAGVNASSGYSYYVLGYAEKV